MILKRAGPGFSTDEKRKRMQEIALLLKQACTSLAVVDFDELVDGAHISFAGVSEIQVCTWSAVWQNVLLDEIQRWSARSSVSKTRK